MYGRRLEQVCIYPCLIEVILYEAKSKSEKYFFFKYVYCQRNCSIFVFQLILPASVQHCLRSNLFTHFNTCHVCQVYNVSWKKNKQTSLQLGQISVSLRSGQNCGCFFFFILHQYYSTQETPIYAHSPQVTQKNRHLQDFSSTWLLNRKANLLATALPQLPLSLLLSLKRQSL